MILEDFNHTKIDGKVHRSFCDVVPGWQDEI
jgi:hypothetical protein